jgi:hypothetical protein
MELIMDSLSSTILTQFKFYDYNFYNCFLDNSRLSKLAFSCTKAKDKVFFMTNIIQGG